MLLEALILLADLRQAPGPGAVKAGELPAPADHPPWATPLSLSPFHLASGPSLGSAASYYASAQPDSNTQTAGLAPSVPTLPGNAGY